MGFFLLFPLRRSSLSFLSFFCMSTRRFSKRCVPRGNVGMGPPWQLLQKVVRNPLARDRLDSKAVQALTLARRGVDDIRRKHRLATCVRHVTQCILDQCRAKLEGHLVHFLIDLTAHALDSAASCELATGSFSETRRTLFSGQQRSLPLVTFASLAKKFAALDSMVRRVRNQSHRRSRRCLLGCFIIRWNWRRGARDGARDGRIVHRL